MNFPVAQRELLVAARSPRLFRGRVIAGLIFGVMTGWMFWVMRQTVNTQAAVMTYSFVTNVAMMMCMFSASQTADVISSEKRAGTLGFLFLTDLRGSDVVFGKLLASGLTAFYGLLAILPMISLPVLAGGVPGESLFRSAIALVNSLFFALSLGLWISTRSWEQKKAANAAVWTSIFFLWMLPGIATALEQRWGWFAAAKVVKVFSPSYQLQHANPFGVGMLFDWFWASIAATHALGWIALWRACAIVPHAWQDRPEPLMGRFKARWNEIRYGTRAMRARLRERLLDLNAVHWLTSRERFVTMGPWIFIGLTLAGWVGMWKWINWASRGDAPFWAVGVPSVMVMQVGLRMRTCSLASEVLARDRFSGALELLLSTTMSVPEVIRGIWLTMRRVIALPALASCGVGFAIFLMAISSVEKNDEAYDRAWLLFPALLVLFVTDLIASAWTGMWMSCICRQPNVASGMCMARLLGMPWIGFFGCLSLIGFFQFKEFFEKFENVFIVWFFFCFVNNLFWMKRSRRKFYETLRFAASERYHPALDSEAWWKFWKWFSKNAERIEVTPAPAPLRW